jgi:hypothetical protein
MKALMFNMVNLQSPQQGILDQLNINCSRKTIYYEAGYECIRKCKTLLYKLLTPTSSMEYSS